MLKEPAVFHPDGNPNESIPGIIHYSRVPGVASYFLPYSSMEFTRITTKTTKITTITTTTTTINKNMRYGTIVTSSGSISPIRGSVDVTGGGQGKAEFVPDNKGTSSVMAGNPELHFCKCCNKLLCS